MELVHGHSYDPKPEVEVLEEVQQALVNAAGDLGRRSPWGIGFRSMANQLTDAIEDRGGASTSVLHQQLMQPSGDRAGLRLVD